MTLDESKAKRRLNSAESARSVKSSEAKYRSIVERMTDGFYRSSPEGRFLEVNPAMVRMLGYESREELMAVDIKSDLFFDSTDRESALLKEKKDEMAVFRLRRKDGSEVWVEDHGQLVSDPSGKILYHEGILRDITERRRLEEQLWQAQKMEAVGQLAGGVAHDFNNLLTVIAGHAELIRSALHENDPIFGEIVAIENSAGRAAALIEQLLAYSRKQLLRPRRVQLGAITASLRRILERVVGEDTLLITEIDPKLGLITADPGQIEQVIVNLVINARDAMPEGGLLKIVAENRFVTAGMAKDLPGLKAGDYVSLSVSDTGTGIDEETQRRIFEPFFTTKDKGKGTGLGLATVYGIVKQTGGYIYLDSAPGEGTKFTLLFPRVEGSLKARPAKKKEKTRARGGKERILVVEDEAPIRALICRVLKGKGYDVFDADSGVEAMSLARFGGTSIDLLVTDVVMPGMNGLEISERLSQLFPALKVIYISGYAEPASSIIKGNRLPKSRFIQKPFKPEKLVRKVRSVLDEAIA
jgi:PAS domain S-box-containing protein